MERPLMAIGRKIWPVQGDPLRRNPSRAATPRPAEPGFERWMWYFTRISGLLLVILAMGHMGIMHVLVQLTGQEINFAFVLERWGNPFWRIYDLLLLVLALLHGANGARIIISDYVERGGLRSLLIGILLAITFVWLLLGVKLEILSEVMLFGALFAAYFVIRSESGGWPPEGQERPELLLPGLNTLLLISSSVTMQWAVRAIGQGQVATMRLGLRVTLLLGSIFILVQGYEFATNGFGLDAGVFGSTFYTLTGFHGAHVLAGLGFMAIVATRARRGLISGDHHTAVEAASYYWHFVDAVWVVLFSTLYVL